MEHLRQAFLDDLAEESNTFVRDGHIFIREHHWAPNDVLAALLDKDALQSTFDLWLAERAEAMVSAADEILKDNKQEDRFLALAEACKNDLVFPFIGAGMSQPSGYPGWTAFLWNIRHESNLSESDMQVLIDNGQYEEVAETLVASLGGEFNETVQNTFGTTRELNGPILLLPHIFRKAMFTTNFDDVIMRCARQSGLPFDYVFTLREGKELARLLASTTGKRCLVKLHGRSITDADRVLTKSEYDRHYINGDAKHAVETVFNRTLLFLGCQLTVDRTLAVMRELVSARGHDGVPRHYAFMCLPDTPQKKAATRDRLLECNIYPIWFPAGTHNESIEAFLWRLKAEGDND